MSERRLTVADPSGLHMRQAARLVQAAGRFSCRITLSHGGREADARSLIAILGLGVGPSAEVSLVAEGDDADEALDAIAVALLAEASAADASAADGEVAAGSSSASDP